MAPPRKKTKLSTSQPTEILFDVFARQDYLTGFHKRKVARIEHAKEAAIKRAKEEKVQERRQMREQRKVDLQKHVEEVNKELRKMNPDISSDEEDVDVIDQVMASAPPQFEPDEEEYVDEDKYTTVTVEAMDDEGEAEPEDAVRAAQTTGAADTATKSSATSKSRPGQQKRKKKKFRYETKAERKETRMKQKARNSKAAKARKEQ